MLNMLPDIKDTYPKETTIQTLEIVWELGHFHRALNKYLRHTAGFQDFFQ